MAMAVTGRNLLAMLLVLAISPLSLRASAACNIITCSFHETTAPGLTGQVPQGAGRGSVRQDAGMHCHGSADSDGTHRAVFRDHQNPCHQEQCLRPEKLVRRARALGKCADPTQAIEIERSAAASVAAFVAAPPISRDSRARLPQVFAVSGILRI